MRLKNKEVFCDPRLSNMFQLSVILVFQVQKEIAEDTGTAYLPREKWDAWDPILIAEGLFATANIFRYGTKTLPESRCNKFYYAE